MSPFTFKFVTTPIVQARPKIENYLRGPVNPRNTSKIFRDVANRLEEIHRRYRTEKYYQDVKFISPKTKLTVQEFTYYWFHISKRLIETTDPYEEDIYVIFIRECIEDAIRALSNHIRIESNPELQFGSNTCYRLYLSNHLCKKNINGKIPHSIDDAIFSIEEFTEELELSGVAKPFYPIEGLNIYMIPESRLYSSIAPDGTLPDQPLALFRELSLFLCEDDRYDILQKLFNNGDKKSFNDKLITYIKNFLKVIISKYNLSMDEPEICKQCEKCHGYANCTLANGKPPALNHKEKVLVQFCKPVVWNPKSKKER